MRRLLLPTLAALALSGVLAPGCSSDEDEPARTRVTLVLGAGELCVKDVTAVDLVATQVGAADFGRRIRGVDLPASTLLDLASDGQSAHDITATYLMDTATGAMSIPMKMRLPAGSTGQTRLSLPCGCIGMTCASGTQCAELPANTGKVKCVAVTECGNGACEAGESRDSCAADCGSTCGDGTCAAGETCATCAVDCDADCGSAGGGGAGGGGGSGASGGPGAGGGGAGGTSGSSGQGGQGGACTDSPPTCTEEELNGPGISKPGNCANGFQAVTCGGGCKENPPACDPSDACGPLKTVPANCAGGQVTCGTSTPEDDCAADTWRCQGETLEKCSLDAFSCRRWVGVKSCGNGTTCSDKSGDCVCPPGSCEPGVDAPRCGSGKGYEICQKAPGSACAQWDAIKCQTAHPCSDSLSWCMNGCQAGDTACLCGNGACDPGENFGTCPGDCATCGNGSCDAGETCGNCVGDCGVEPQQCVPDSVVVCKVKFCTGTRTCSPCGEQGACIYDDPTCCPVPPCEVEPIP